MPVAVDAGLLIEGVRPVTQGYLQQAESNRNTNFMDSYLAPIEAKQNMEYKKIMSEAYKQQVAAQMLSAQREADPNSLENRLKESQIEKNMRTANLPTSDVGKLLYDRATRPELFGDPSKTNAAGVPSGGKAEGIAVSGNPYSIGGMNLLTGQKAPAGYDWDATDPTKLTPIQGGPHSPEKKITASSIGWASAIKNTMQDVELAKNLLFDKNGSLKRTAAITGKVSLPYNMMQGIPFTEGREARQALTRALTAKLRLESGAAVPDSEVDRYTAMFMPTAFDSNESAQKKMNGLNNFLNTALDLYNGGKKWNDENTNKADLFAKNALTAAGAPSTPEMSKPPILTDSDAKRIADARGISVDDVRKAYNDRVSQYLKQ